MAETIRVGCRLSAGVKLSVKQGVIELKGHANPNNVYHHVSPDRHGDAHVAYTEVDKRLMEMWLGENANSDLVTSGTIFVVSQEEAAAPEAT